MRWSRRSASSCIESGECYQTLDDDLPALECFLDALAIDSEHADAGARAADILWSTQRWKELVKVLEMLLRKKADAKTQLQRWSRLAMAARTLGLSEKAVKAWLRTLELEPRHHEALKAMTEHFLAEERWTEALPLLDRRFQHHHEKLSPVEIVDLFGDMARCEVALGAREAARELITRALAIDPMHRPSLLLGAGGRGTMGETAQAIEAWREALKHTAGDHKRLHKCLDAYVAARDWPRARAVLEALIEAERSAEVRAKYRHTAGLHLPRRAQASRSDARLSARRARRRSQPGARRDRDRAAVRRAQGLEGAGAPLSSRPQAARRRLDHRRQER
jgi:tetratricopeptide (TPR) repeat protein